MAAATALTSVAAAAAADEFSPQQLEFFEKKVRPVLVERCYPCHSASAKKLKGGLRLDSRAGVIKGGDTGPAISPGEPGKSRLIEAIGYGNIDVQMPPKSKLPEAVIADLTAWVKMGAPWPLTPGSGAPAPGSRAPGSGAAGGSGTAGTAPAQAADGGFPLAERKEEHWAWRALSAPTPPTVKNAAWVRDPIDRFVLAKLEAAGLQPAAPADKRTLIRRAYFAIVGLPPSPQEVEAFVNDTSPTAYEALIDRLLASPRFGERWGRHWLDLVRYAETYGHEFDYPIPDAWRYRDYVIRAFNADVPYDQFVTEHVAGDLLPKPRRNPDEGYDESVIATGFWFFHEQTHAPTDVRQHEADRIDNQIDVFSKTFLGFTVACARCHDHKFDAISTKDYYGLAGYLQSSRQREAGLDPGGRIAGAVAKVKAVRGEADRAIAEAHVPSPQPTTQDSPGTVLFEDFNHDGWGGWFADGQAFGDGPTRSGQWDAASGGGGASAVRPGLAHSGMLGGKQRGVLRSPTFTVEHPQVHIRAAGKGHVRLVIDGYTMAHFNGLLFGGTETEINRPDKLGWTTLGGDLKMYLGHTAYLEFIDDDDDWLAVDEVRFSDGGARLSPDEPLSVEPVAEQAATFAAFKQRFDQVNAATPAPVTVLAITDGTGENSPVYIRGSHKTLGPQAPREMLVAIAGDHQPRLSPADGSGRLQLARELVDPSLTPQVPRVMVNRTWHHLFGRGIVATTDDFGFLGKRPTHPELLNHLADRFVKDGWSVKRMIRAIMLSSTYRMSSAPGSNAGDPADPAYRAAERTDPDNLLLHRMPITRLEGEVIRDSILAISGRLNEKMFGPPVAVYLTPFMNGRGRPSSGPLDGDGRRSIYTAVRRNFLPPMMLAFDTPQPVSTRGRRSVSNVPAQALILMNDPLVVQQAQVWAKRVFAQRDLTPTQRVTLMYETAFARPPSEKELADAMGFIDQQGEAYGLNAQQRAGDERVWADLGHVLFNVKEFIFVR
jgi:Protein of unknown function (DUF1549)/Protein of unknown function (DUF1553)/Planctomycete cytochrome C